MAILSDIWIAKKAVGLPHVDSLTGCVCSWNYMDVTKKNELYFMVLNMFWNFGLLWATVNLFTLHPCIVEL